jgi:hypothetical protein
MRHYLLGAVLLGLGTVLGAQSLPNPSLAQPLARPKAGASLTHRKCAACHVGHKGAGLARKAKVQKATLDQICIACHEGPSLAPTAEGAPKLPTWNGQGSAHLSGRFGTRRAGEYSRTFRQGAKTLRLVMDCSGCHDPHGKERGRLRTTAFDSRGQLLNRPPQAVAEVCFGCHAGTEAAPLASSQADIGALFAMGIASGHTIGATAKGRPELPSLRTSAFQEPLDCGSCHGNPDPSGALGPHVSPNVALLKAPFGREKDLALLGERANDLCFTCHDKQSILANQSFAFHAQHLNGFTSTGSAASQKRNPALSEAVALLGVRSSRDLRPGRAGAYLPGFGEPTTCATCHAAHGSTRAAALIEFDRSVVSPSSVGAPSFQRTGLGHGTCTLTCHGYDHAQTRY